MDGRIGDGGLTMVGGVVVLGMRCDGFDIRVRSEWIYIVYNIATFDEVCKDSGLKT